MVTLKLVVGCWLLVVPVNCTAVRRGEGILGGLREVWAGEGLKPGATCILKGVIVASAVIGGAYVIYKLCDEILGDECDTWQGIKRNYFRIVGGIMVVAECYLYYQIGLLDTFKHSLGKWGLETFMFYHMEVIRRIKKGKRR